MRRGDPMNPAFKMTGQLDAAEPAQAIYWGMATAAKALDMSPEALRCKLRRSNLPPGIVRKWGRSVLLHRERLLGWLEAGK